MANIKASVNEQVSPTTTALDLTALAKSTLFDLPLACTSEGLRFLQHRLQAQAEHLQALLHCASGADVVAENVRFAFAGVSDYLCEAGAMMRQAHDVLARRPETASSADSLH